MYASEGECKPNFREPPQSEVQGTPPARSTRNFPSWTYDEEAWRAFGGAPATVPCSEYHPFGGSAPSPDRSILACVRDGSTTRRPTLSRQVRSRRVSEEEETNVAKYRSALPQLGGDFFMT